MSEKIQCLKNTEWLARLSEARGGLSNTLYAMYSGLTGGITTDPALMMIPADDHLPQRGDEGIVAQTIPAIHAAGAGGDLDEVHSGPSGWTGGRSVHSAMLARPIMTTG